MATSNRQQDVVKLAFRKSEDREVFQLMLGLLSHATQQARNGGPIKSVISAAMAALHLQQREIDLINGKVRAIQELAKTAKMLREVGIGVRVQDLKLEIERICDS